MPGRIKQCCLITKLTGILLLSTYTPLISSLTSRTWSLPYPLIVLVRSYANTLAWKMVFQQNVLKGVMLDKIFIFIIQGHCVEYLSEFHCWISNHYNEKSNNRVYDPYCKHKINEKIILLLFKLLIITVIYMFSIHHKIAPRGKACLHVPIRFGPKMG